ETATRINTVSPTYARELLSNPNLAGDVAWPLQKRQSDFNGILNGIDTEYWNPATDPHLAANYDSRHLDDKEKNRTALLEQCQLDIAPGKPVFGSVSRLVESKGFEFILRAIPGLVERGAGLVFLGTGEEKYQQALEAFAKAFPGRVFYNSGFNEPLAHLIEAGADLFLMPSRFEPCGLNQMYSLRYGTLPVVHRTGGLADSVISWEQPGGCGFMFTPYRFTEFQDALDDGFRCFKDQNFWRKLQVAAMQRDFSWERSAREYKKLYIECWKSGQNHEKT
ncbi:MAG: glycosyltransferase, partial [FCB group bacterium]|nr:glycosyltransferase [FCB group bacterium]